MACWLFCISGVCGAFMYYQMYFVSQRNKSYLLKRFEGLIWRPCKSRLSDLTLKRFHLESLTLCMVTVKLLAFSFFSIDFRNSKLILKQKYRLFALKLFSWIKQSELFKVIIKSSLFVSITVGSMGENFFKRQKFFTKKRIAYIQLPLGISTFIKKKKKVLSSSSWNSGALWFHHCWGLCSHSARRIYWLEKFMVSLSLFCGFFVSAMKTILHSCPQFKTYQM